jgi:hypothetical protein
MLWGMTNAAAQPDNLGGIPPWISTELMAETRTVWQPYYESVLTDEDILALLMPVGVLYEILFSKGVKNEEVDEANEANEDGEEVHRARPR